MKAIPTIAECMTTSPQTIGEDIKLSDAAQRMRQFRIRHLPVLAEGKLVGILTDRDIKLALSVHPTATDLKVGDIMSEDVYAVEPETPLDKATENMFRNKYGCAVIRDMDGTTVGVFTANDAVQVLTALLRGAPLAASLNSFVSPTLANGNIA